MKIAQFYDKGRIRLGIIEADRLHTLRFEGDMIDFWAEGKGPVKQDHAMPLENPNFAFTATRPYKTIALGLNYEDYARKSKEEIPDVPLIFAKFPSSLVGQRHS